MLERFREILKRPDCRLCEILDHKKLVELEQSEGSAFRRNWYGQLMTTPQMFAYLLQLEYWLRKYDVIIEK